MADAKLNKKADARETKAYTLYSEHLRWTKDGLHTHEDIYNGRGDSTDWSTQRPSGERRAHIVGQSGFRLSMRLSEVRSGPWVRPSREIRRYLELDEIRSARGVEGGSEPHTGRAARHGGPAARPRVS